MYIKRGDSYTPTNEANLDIHYNLPAGVYTIAQDPFENLYFKQGQAFVLPSKIYGDTVRVAERIFSTYMARTNSTGALFTGEKGSGKTLLSKVLAAMAVEKGLPVILVNSPFCGDKFNALIQELPDALILFDEFEKVYEDTDSQNSVLTLLDGVFPSRKLFAFTCNDRWSLNQYLINRPGRIFYAIDYQGLTPEFIEEYCQDNLNAKEHTPLIIKASGLFQAFNFDMLQALVEEMNRYNETPHEALRLLNIRPMASEVSYRISLALAEGEVDEGHLEDREFERNPTYLERISVGYRTAGGDWQSARFIQSQLTEADLDKGTYTYVNEKGDTVTFTKKLPQSTDYFKHLF
jgi:SpoVK/Ycf46/Vps4 family AAA+-type ATPase